MADLVAASAPRLGIKVLGNEGLDIKAANYRAIGQKIKASGADCMFYGATTANQTIGVWRDVNVANPDMKLFALAGMADSAFHRGDPRIRTAHDLPDEPDDRSEALSTLRSSVLQGYAKRFGQQPESYAIYGYEAMKLALTAIERAGDRSTTARR